MAARVSGDQIEVQLNGRPKVVRPGQSLEGLLEDLELDGRTVVVELNRRIVRRADLGETSLETGDEVELVHFVGGG